MMDFTDKAFIGLASLTLFLIESSSLPRIVPILTAASIVCLTSYLSSHIARPLFFILYLLLSLRTPSFVFFLPVVSYDFLSKEDHYLGWLSIFPILISFTYITTPYGLFILLFLSLAALLRKRTSDLLAIKKQHVHFQDESRENALLLTRKNKELMEKQDYEIHLATLNERNRIAREIHDHVGHMLSRCLLQIGALLVINKDETLNESLELIKETLSDSMTSIRSSVHDLHNDSLDLHAEVKKLIQTFTFCDIYLDYDFTSDTPRNLKYGFIAILKEALANIIKHSNATEVHIVFREHPALYQLIIEDNGYPNASINFKNGIGLTNISDRISQMHGQLNITVTQGFKVFISIPKEVI